MYFDTPRPVFAFPTLCMILLRECRQERELTVEVIADQLGISGADWEKAEAAKVAFDFPGFTRACDVLGLRLTEVFTVAESYAAILQGCNWVRLYKKPQRDEQDFLLQQAKAFWKTRLGAGTLRDYPVLGYPDFRTGVATPLFRYALDPHYRHQLNFPQPLSFDLSLTAINGDLPVET